MGAIEGIGQSRLGEYIQSKLTERDVGGVPQAHVGDSGNQSPHGAIGFDGGTILLCGTNVVTGFLEFVELPDTLDAVTRVRSSALIFTSEVGTRRIVATGARFWGVSNSSSESLLWNLTRGSFAERLANMSSLPLLTDLAMLSSTRVVALGGSLSGPEFGKLHLLEFDEAMALQSQHAYDPASSDFNGTKSRLLLDGGSIWVTGSTANTNAVYLQVDRSTFTVTKAKTVSALTAHTGVQQIALLAPRLAILIQRAGGDILVLVDITTDTVLWAKRVTTSGITLAAVVLTTEAVFVFGVKNGSMFAAKLAVSDGSLQKSNAITSVGQLAAAAANGQDIWTCGHQSTQTFGFADYQIFRLQDISDTGTAMALTSESPTVSDGPSIAKTTPSFSLSTSDGTADSGSFSIAETTFTI